MNKQMRWIIIGLLLLSLSSIACSLTGGDDEETAIESAVESAVSEAEEAVDEAIAEAGGEEAIESTVEAVTEAADELVAIGETINATELGKALDFSSIFDGETVQSYQYDMVLTISSDEGSGETAITMLYSADPSAMSMTMNFSGEIFAEDAEMGQVHMVEIGDSIYMDVPEMGCIQMPSTDSNLTDEMMGDIFSNDIVNDLETLVKVGDETINGVETTHYTFDEAAFMDTADEMETAVGHIYVAKDGGYMVRMSIDGTGDVGDFSGSDGVANGTMHMEMNLTNINEPIQIDAPADCESFGDSLPFGGEDSGISDDVPADYPIVADATDLFSMSGVASYTTAMSLEDVIAFYQSELPAMGWVENPDMHLVVAGTASMTFNKDSKVLSLTINDDPNATTTVTILTMGE